jgi:ABC-2 type transport system ATP-binding protein
MPERCAALDVADVSKTFEVPQQHVMTLKERALHPFRSIPVTELRALEGVSFQVLEGEFFGVVGRNGSGKSTLLKCLAGIYPVDSGQMSVAGRVVPFIELGVGFHMEMTALDNAVVNGVMMGLSAREARRRFDEVMAFAELEDFVDLKLKNYSSGMQVRLAFALMLEAEADVYLIDEVLAVGDAAFQQKCMDSFTELKRAGRTIVLVTHDMAMVQRFCDRALLLEDGRIHEEGDPDDVAQSYLELNFAREGAGTAAPVVRDGATVADVWIEDGAGNRVDTVEPHADIAICALVEAHERIAEPDIGVTVHDEQGTVLIGAAMVASGVREPAIEPGERVRIRVGVENVLAPGRWFVDCGVHDGPERVVGFRWRARDFTVTGKPPRAGLIKVARSFEVEREPLRAEAPR